jgi:hypothetical protein
MTGAEDLARAWLEQLESERDALPTGMENVFNAHHGESVSKVLMALWNEFDRLGIPVTVEWLLPYARTISSGQRVDLESQDAEPRSAMPRAK